MVTADEVNSIGVSQFQTDKKGNGLDTKHAAVDIVAYNDEGRMSVLVFVFSLFAPAL